MTSNIDDSVLIVGAGHAAGEMAIALRMNGYTGAVTLVGEEPHLPYQRPPLSKAFLSGEITVERLHVKAPATYDNAKIEFVPNERAVAIDRVARTVTMEDGRTLSYGKLVLATGGRPRLLTLPDPTYSHPAGTRGVGEGLSGVRGAKRKRPRFKPRPGRRLSAARGSSPCEPMEAMMCRNVGESA